MDLVRTSSQSLYSEPLARMSVKGYSSDYLIVHRGTWKGFPLSPILFILALEPLAIKIWHNIDIQGIPCGHRVNKCAMFADDILMLLSSSITSIPNLYREFNHSKSQALNLTLEDSLVNSL